LPLVTASTLQELQEQNLAVLKALDQLRVDRDAALDRYTETITNQLNTLTETLTLQRQQQLQAARDSSRFVLTIAATIAGLAVLMVLASALLPLWTLKHFSATRTLSRAGPFRYDQSTLGSEAGFLAGAEAVARSPLGGALEKLEERLMALEQKNKQLEESTPKEAPPVAKAIVAPGKPEPLRPQPSKPAHLAITLGQGEAIVFLPRDTDLSRFHFCQAFFDKIRKLFLRLAKFPNLGKNR